MKQFLFLRRGLAVLLASAVLITDAVLTSAEPELPPSDQENSEFLSSNDQPSSEVDNSSSDITTDVPRSPEQFSREKIPPWRILLLRTVLMQKVQTVL